MAKLIQRKSESRQIKEFIRLFPVTAILGPRQTGKTVLARQIKHDHYFDLENPRDLAKFDNPQLLLESLQGTIIIDEIQRKKDLFPLLRYLVDHTQNQKYLILGSASQELIRQSSESLAGRIAYYQLGGLRLTDVGMAHLKKMWLRGSFPRPYLSSSGKNAFLWLSNYIQTFLERDIPQLGISIPAGTLRRFWLMLSHYHGQILNFSELSRSFGVSDMTARKYIDILEKTFMVRVLQPWHANLKKRLVKRPKIYLRDSGIFHSLMTIETLQQLTSHNKCGASWEGFALEAVAKIIGKRAEELYFWSTHTGAEVDLFWQEKGKNWAIEFKYQDAPQLTRSMQAALTDLDLKHLWVVYPGRESYQLSKQVSVLSLHDLKDSWIYT